MPCCANAAAEPVLLERLDKPDGNDIIKPEVNGAEQECNRFPRPQRAALGRRQEWYRRTGPSSLRRRGLLFFQKKD